MLPSRALLELELVLLLSSLVPPELLVRVPELSLLVLLQVLLLSSPLLPLPQSPVLLEPTSEPVPSPSYASPRTRARRLARFDGSPPSERPAARLCLAPLSMPGSLNAIMPVARAEMAGGARGMALAPRASSRLVCPRATV